MVSLSYKTIMWLIPDALFLIFVLVANTGLVIAFVATTVDVSEAEANIAMHRLYFSPNGISEYDAEAGIERVYSGKVDPARFKDSQIENALKYENIVMATRLSADTEKAYLNRDKYEQEWAIFAVIAEETGGGGAVPYPEARYIVFDGKPSKLETVVLMPR